MNSNLYNLFVSADEHAWESTSSILDRSRCFEHTESDLKQKYGAFSFDELEELKQAPCIFAYENYINKDAYAGYITEILVRSTGIKMTFDRTDTIPLKLINQFKFELDIGDWELNRTHWALKKVNLRNLTPFQDISFGTSSTTNQPIDISKHQFDIAVTFAGEHRDFVKPIVDEVEKRLGSSHVFYDNNFISQLARPSLNTLLQNIYRNQAKLVVVFLDAKYQEKKWCGLEFRIVQEIVMKKDVKKIMYIRLDDEEVEGVLHTDGYIDGTRFSTEELASFICERVALLV